MEETVHPDSSNGPGLKLLLVSHLSLVSFITLEKRYSLAEMFKVGRYEGSGLLRADCSLSSRIYSCYVTFNHLLSFNNFRFCRHFCYIVI